MSKEYDLLKLLKEKFLKRTTIFFGNSPTKKDRYSSIELSEGDIEKGNCKRHFGGSVDGWELRGKFQLFFLKGIGMRRESKLLDVGCGAGRGSNHLIAFLDDNNYWGIDSNASFVKAALAMVDQKELHNKHPNFQVVQNFDLRHSPEDFDYVLLFSVLNHCDVNQKSAFFEKVPNLLKTDGKIYISHASWFNKSYLENTSLKVSRKFTKIDYDITQFGWNKNAGIFPIMELTKL